MSPIAEIDERPSGLFETELAYRALMPPERLAPSAWAERHAYLKRGQSAIPGRVSFSNFPWQRDIIDAAKIPGVSQIAIKKAAQLGISETARFYVGYLADLEPDPIGLLMPDEAKGKSIMAGHYRPMFESWPKLQNLRTSRARDISDASIMLSNGFSMRLMWSGSASSTASEPYRVVICDEVDKFAKFAGEEGSAIDQARKRTRTFGERALMIYISTPTTRAGNIHQLWHDSHFKLYFLLPCPHCGVYQRLVFEQVKWPDFDTEIRSERAQRVRSDGAAWIECLACAGAIREHDKLTMLSRAKWGTCDENTWLAGGEIEDLRTVKRLPPGTRLGFQISALYLMQESVSKVAEEFLLAIGSYSKMFDFRTQTLGEVFEDLLATVDDQWFRDRCDEATLEEGVCPWWTAALVAAVDTQADHYWVVIRAFGPQWRTHLVFQGRVESKADLDRLTDATAWRNEREGIPPRIVDLTLIDSGGTKSIEDSEEGAELASKTMEVYDWVRRRPGKRRAIKGASKRQPGEIFKRGKGVYVSKREKHPLPIWLLDSHELQDQLQFLMGLEVESGVDKETGEVITERAFTLNKRFDATYAKHMSNLQKVVDRQGDKVLDEWRPVGAGARVDLRHCEGYAIAGAYMLQVHLLGDLKDWAAQQEAQRKDQERLRAQPRRTGMRMPDGRPWLATNRK
jgi:phage terminase large subunit GpA-like protein